MGENIGHIYLNNLFHTSIYLFIFNTILFDNSSFILKHYFISYLKRVNYPILIYVFLFIYLFIQGVTKLVKHLLFNNKENLNKILISSFFRRKCSLRNLKFKNLFSSHISVIFGLNLVCVIQKWMPTIIVINFFPTVTVT